MATLLKVLGFSLALTLVFTLVSNTLPQVEGEAPVEQEIELGDLTMDGFVAMGETLFSGKGTCTLCHNELGRAPDILALDMIETSRERMADARYQGEARDLESYLRESMVSPEAYVVQGFGKKGSKDTESPMPAVDKAPIQLNPIQIDAIIAFMQAKDGNTVTVALPTDAPPDETAGEISPGADAAPAIAQSPEEAIAKYGCAACHTVLETESPVGPSLVDVGERLSVSEIRESILDPGMVIAEGFPPIMPMDFGDRMTAGELEMMVRYFSGDGR